MYNFAHVYHCQIIIFVQCISFVQCTPFCNVYLLSNVYICPMWGTWIAEWYHTWLWSLVHCAMHWAVSLSLSDNKLFFGPKHNIFALFMILFGLFDLILLFVCQICHVYCETENWKLNKFILKNVPCPWSLGWMPQLLPNNFVFYKSNNRKMLCWIGPET